MAVYTVVPMAVFSATAVATPPLVNTGATSSRSLIARLTACSASLPDASVDAVVCAQAFHWFATTEALSEIARVLKPEGVARVIGFLASAESAPMTGAILDYEQTVFGGHGRPAAYPGRDE